MLWKDRLGRLHWFETGKVSLYVRRPASLGTAYQPVCNGFSFTDLTTDIKVLESALAGVKFKAHVNAVACVTQVKAYEIQSLLPHESRLS